ncbi:MAG TPA: chemotaxis protein CheW [Gemmatimonadaceae bacterium]|nr:chemotaxis protein CheW [Gemmatimonadaceae bacterium]
MDDLLRDFLTESNENLLQLDRDIVALEQHPEDASLINGIFRTIHTIKGTCGFIGLDRLEAVAHAAESVLSAVREGSLAVSDQLISDVLAAVDVIKAILAHLEQTEAEPAGDDSALIAILNAILTGERAEGPKGLRAEEVRRVTPLSAPVAAAEADPVAEQRSAISDSTLRVHVDLLDKLMTLVGELVLDRNRLIQLTAHLDDSVFAAPVQHLNRVTTDLQEAVMKTRMQPIGGAWTKLPRVVRDLAHASGKKLHLDMVGAETELDRQILQAIADPMTHMIRNSADHGVEMPADRKAAGKPEMGTIRLKAYHEGGHVIIEVSDDGAGIDADRVRTKAIERGLVTREAAEGMTEHQVLRFIFEPGFSTAKQITSVSGRGVGMDVVRTNIERIGGQVELHSVRGQGTSVRVKIPLTLAIIPALVVVAGEHRYAIPQVNLLELVRIGGDGTRGVEQLHGAPVYRLRGRLLPLVYLSRVLGLERAESRGAMNMVVLQAEGRSFGLVVDALRDSEEIVVKPLGSHLKQVSVFAGATIMGDGRVALILDVPGLARNAHVVDDSQSRDSAAQHARRSSETHRAARTVLVVQAGERERVAIDLARVNRLEEFRRDAIEFSHGVPVAQYRGDVIPLLSLSEAIGLPSLTQDDRERVPVIVHSQNGHTVGLIVDRILDIVADELVIHRERARDGVVGTAVIQGRVTDLLDLDSIVSRNVAIAELTAPPNTAGAFA